MVAHGSGNALPLFRIGRDAAKSQIVCQSPEPAGGHLVDRLDGRILQACEGRRVGWMNVKRGTRLRKVPVKGGVDRPSAPVRGVRPLHRQGIVTIAEDQVRSPDTTPMHPPGVDEEFLPIRADRGGEMVCHPLVPSIAAGEPKGRRDIGADCGLVAVWRRLHTGHCLTIPMRFER